MLKSPLTSVLKRNLHLQYKNDVSFSYVQRIKRLFCDAMGQVCQKWLTKKKAPHAAQKPIVMLMITRITFCKDFELAPIQMRLTNYYNIQHTIKKNAFNCLKKKKKCHWKLYIIRLINYEVNILFSGQRIQDDIRNGQSLGGDSD